jgi:hypothetical protein
MEPVPTNGSNTTLAPEEEEEEGPIPARLAMMKARAWSSEVGPMYCLFFRSYFLKQQ